MGNLSLTKISAAHSLTQAGLSHPAGVHTVLQTTEQKTANPQMRKQVEFLMPSKALSMESFLYWFKPVAETKKKKKAEKTAFGRNAFSLVGDACSTGHAETAGLLEIHRSAGDTLPPCVHKEHQQPTLRAPPHTAVG